MRENHPLDVANKIVSWNNVETIEDLNTYYRQRLGEEAQPFIRLLPLKNSGHEYLEVMFSRGGFLFRLFEECPESKNEFLLVFHPVLVAPKAPELMRNLSEDRQEHQSEWRIFLCLESETPAIKSIQWMINHAKSNFERQLLQQFVITSKQCLKTLLRLKYPPSQLSLF